MDKQIEDQFTALENCSWFPFNDEPVLSSTEYAPYFSDPQVLLADQSCDGKWHMFFHSWIGIHHFISDSGIYWEPRKMIEVRGHSPYLYREKDCYYLLYEKHDRDYLFSKKTESNSFRSSRIEVRSSSDLITWSKPRVLLEAKDIPFAGDYVSNPRITKPQLVKINGVYRLYFGASHVVVPDTGNRFTRYFSFAESKELQGKYKMEDNNRILIEPIPDDRFSNLASGNISVVKVGDGFYGFQCAAFWDGTQNKTCSYLMLIKSDDGLVWKRCNVAPLLVTTKSGWSDTYIKSCNVRYSETEKSWYCYFSAVGHDGKGKIKESIGLLLGTVPVVQENKDEKIRNVLASFFG